MAYWQIEKINLKIIRAGDALRFNEKGKAEKRTGVEKLTVKNINFIA